MPQLRFFLELTLLHLLAVSIKILTVTATADQTATPTDQNVDPGDPLYLTPLIESGEIAKAVEAALVQDFSSVVSYSGLINVNSTYNSNIFFWFVPAEGKQIDDNDAPVILWSDGGPGISCMFSVFQQNGPFTVTPDGEGYTINPFSWHKKYNMIYMDNPVEIGFSFTDNEDGYITSAPEAARDIYEFLTQFFQLFPHLQKNPFYNGGASYGATYAIQTANYIHQKNLESPKISINLTGLIVDSPWIEAYSQVDYGDYLFNVGVISESSRDYYREQQAEIRNLVEQERYLDAFTAWIQILQHDTLNLTGYGAINNIYNDTMVPVDLTKLVTQNSTRKAIHVGSLRYFYVNLDQQARMQPNMLRSAKPEMDTLLQAGYRFLLYVGNMDANTGHLGVRKVIKSLAWDGASDLLDGTRTIWKENGRVAGYNMTSTNMTFLIIRNAGHGCLLDQPEWVFNAIKNFTW